jgi:hypothetical protein
LGAISITTYFGLTIIFQGSANSIAYFCTSIFTINKIFKTIHNE